MCVLITALILTGATHVLVDLDTAYQVMVIDAMVSMVYGKNLDNNITYVSLQMLTNAERAQTTVLNTVPILWGHMYATVVLDISWLLMDILAMVIIISVKTLR